MKSPKTPLAGYAFAFICVAVAITVRFSLNPVLGERSRFLLLIPPVLLAGMYGGIGPGTFALFFGALLSVLVTLGGFEALGDPANMLNLALYLLIGAGILVIIHREQLESEAREKSELELARLNEELEQKVRERTAELREANAELEGFCYSMAHDLRTPTRSIVGNARILLDDFGDSLTPPLQEKLQRMDRAAHKLSDLVDGLLTYARLKNFDCVEAPVNVSRIIQETIDDLGKKAPCQIELLIEPGITVRADERQLRIAIRAILDNSIKYRKPGKDVRIAVSTRDGDLVIADDGIGFDMSYVHKVFAPFERLVRDDVAPGVGMGLANVQRIMDRHKGQVGIDSHPGEGTTVRLRFAGGAAVSAEALQATVDAA